MQPDQPRLGRPGQEVTGPRELIVGKARYLLPCRVRGATVEMLRVFQISRRLHAPLQDRFAREERLNVTAIGARRGVA